MSIIPRFTYSLILGSVLLFPPLLSPASNPQAAHKANPSANMDSAFQSALNTFRQLSPKEKRNQIREIKNKLRSWKKENHRSAKDAPDDTVLYAPGCFSSSSGRLSERPGDQCEILDQHFAHLAILAARHRLCVTGSI